jgi:hypothetical protein
MLNFVFDSHIRKRETEPLSHIIKGLVKNKNFSSQRISDNVDLTCVQQAITKLLKNNHQS